MPTTSRTGRNAPRSKNGCSTCRIRKVKCDEERPKCSKCSTAGLTCEWNRPLPPRRRAVSQTGKRQDTLGARQRQLEPAPLSEAAASDHLGTESGTPEDQFEVSQDLAPSHPVSETLLPTSLTFDEVELPNSLVLSPQEWRAFQYVPESLMVLRFGKPWHWSMLSWLHKNVAPRESGVMGAFIAVACMELRFRNLVQFGDTITHSSLIQATNLRNSAAKFFSIAIKQLSLLLERVSRMEPSPDEIEALFSMWFLILHCELYDPELIRASPIHLNGIRSFLARYLSNEDGTETRKLPPAAQQLLLFITYLDVNLALGDLNGGQLCLDLMSIQHDSPLAYDQIWKSARTCLPRLWGADYPVEEILDDAENYRGLSFLHACQKLKLDTWQMAVADGRGTDTLDIRTRLWNRIEETGEEFLDLLILGKTAKGSGGRRVMWTVYHACLDYYAVKVLFSCLDKHDTTPQWLDKALADLLSIAHKSLGEDPQQLYRTSFPLAVAFLKVRDPIHRDWIQAQLRRARVLLSDVGLPPRLLDASGTSENVLLEFSQSISSRQLEEAA